MKNTKILFICWGAFTAALVGILVYQFGWKALERTLYERGQSQVWQLLSQQLNQKGRLELPATNASGTAGVIIFIPQESCKTESDN